MPDWKAAIDKLETCVDSHGFYAPTIQQTIGDLFGVKLDFHEIQATGGKGLTLDNGAKSAIGIGGWELALQLCKKLEIEYEPYLGRGFQFRACIKALREHFGVEK